MLELSNHEPVPVAADTLHRPGKLRAVVGRAARALPSLGTFALLGGILLWGHQTGWTLPKFSALRGGPPAATEAWCAEHNVPEDECVECVPGLMPRPRAHGWCKAHGVHECPLCHPEVAQTAKRPAVTAADRDRASRALALLDRAENNSKCKLHTRRIQFTSAEAVEKAGVEVEPVWTAPVIEAVSANGEVTYDPNRTARLSARAPGTVFRVLKQVGDPVKTGEIVALIDAAEVGRAKGELLQALAQVRYLTTTVDRLRRAEMSGTGSPQSRLDAEATLNDARIRQTKAEQALTNLGLPVELAELQKTPDGDLPAKLRFLGLPKTILTALDPKTTTGNLLPLTAPLDGIVASRDVVPGEVVDLTKVLFLAVDARSMWLTLDLRQEDARAVRLGQKVLFRPTGAKAEVGGVLGWVSTEVNDKTRTVKVRADLDNATGRLRSNTFGPGKVVLREEEKAVVVPAGALHWEGCCHVVFVRDKDFLKPGAPKVFHTRSVRPGARDEQTAEIIAGVLPGEVVVARGSAALRAELLRGELGEG